MNPVSTDTHAPLNVLLADDDIDDRHFFDKALKSSTIQTRLATVDDGVKLMAYLSENYQKLPDVLFLDLNMPRKNGSECLAEIHQDERFKHIPVIIYSTYNHEKDADLLYNHGAYYYIRKTDMIELAKILQSVLTRIIQNEFTRPPKDKFIFIRDRV